MGRGGGGSKEERKERRKIWDTVRDEKDKRRRGEIKEVSERERERESTWEL